MKLTIEQVIALHAGLIALDGYDRVIKDGTQEKIVKDYYKLGGGLRLAIADNICALKSIITSYQTARNALIMDFSGGSGFVMNDKIGEFSVEDAKILAVEKEIDLATIKVSELNLDTNTTLMGSTLALLRPILLRGE